MSGRAAAILLGAIAGTVTMAASGAAVARAAPCQDPAPAAVVTVVVGDGCVAPAEVAVAVEEVVVWRNRSGVAHRMRGAGQSFELPARSSYGRTFDRPGAYRYVCAVHPAVTGVVDVTGSAVELPAARRLRWPLSATESGPLAMAAVAVLLPAAWVLRSLRDQPARRP